MNMWRREAQPGAGPAGASMLRSTRVSRPKFVPQASRTRPPRSSRRVVLRHAWLAKPTAPAISETTSGRHQSLSRPMLAATTGRRVDNASRRTKGAASLHQSRLRIQRPLARSHDGANEEREVALPRSRLSHDLRGAGSTRRTRTTWLHVGCPERPRSRLRRGLATRCLSSRR